MGGSVSPPSEFVGAPALLTAIRDRNHSLVLSLLSYLETARHEAWDRVDDLRQAIQDHQDAKDHLEVGDWERINSLSHGQTRDEGSMRFLAIDCGWRRWAFERAILPGELSLAASIHTDYFTPPFEPYATLDETLSLSVITRLARAYRQMLDEKIEMKSMDLPMWGANLIVKGLVDFKVLGVMTKDYARCTTKNVRQTLALLDKYDLSLPSSAYSSPPQATQPPQPLPNPDPHPHPQHNSQDSLPTPDPSSDGGCGAPGSHPHSPPRHEGKSSWTTRKRSRSVEDEGDAPARIRVAKEVVTVEVDLEEFEGGRDVQAGEEDAGDVAMDVEEVVRQEERHQAEAEGTEEDEDEPETQELDDSRIANDDTDLAEGEKPVQEEQKPPALSPHHLRNTTPRPLPATPAAAPVQPLPSPFLTTTASRNRRDSSVQTDLDFSPAMSTMGRGALPSPALSAGPSPAALLFPSSVQTLHPQPGPPIATFASCSLAITPASSARARPRNSDAAILALIGKSAKDQQKRLEAERRRSVSGLVRPTEEARSRETTEGQEQGQGHRRDVGQPAAPAQARSPQQAERIFRPPEIREEAPVPPRAAQTEPPEGEKEEPIARRTRRASTAPREDGPRKEKETSASDSGKAEPQPRRNLRSRSTTPLEQPAPATSTRRLRSRTPLAPVNEATSAPTSTSKLKPTESGILMPPPPPRSTPSPAFPDAAAVPPIPIAAPAVVAGETLLVPPSSSADLPSSHPSQPSRPSSQDVPPHSHPIGAAAPFSNTSTSSLSHHSGYPPNPYPPPPPPVPHSSSQDNGEETSTSQSQDGSQPGRPGGRKSLLLVPETPVASPGASPGNGQTPEARRDDASRPSSPSGSSSRVVSDSQGSAGSSTGVPGSSAPQAEGVEVGAALQPHSPAIVGQELSHGPSGQVESQETQEESQASDSSVITYMSLREADEVERQALAAQAAKQAAAAALAAARSNGGGAANGNLNVEQAVGARVASRSRSRSRSVQPTAAPSRTTRSRYSPSPLPEHPLSQADPEETSHWHPFSQGISYDNDGDDDGDPEEDPEEDQEGHAHTQPSPQRVHHVGGAKSMPMVKSRSLGDVAGEGERRNRESDRMEKQLESENDGWMEMLTEDAFR